MSLVCTQELPPLDGNLWTGPFRLYAGIGRTLSPTADVQYGEKMRAIWVGTSGDVSYVKWDGTTQVLKKMQAGVWHPVLSLMINGSGTTALDIVVGS